MNVHPEAATPTRVGCDGILEAIGHTPLIRLRRFLNHPEVELFVKLESRNPGGSAKDRPARAMVEAALRSGEIGADTTVVESSSGNMGIGLAQACRYHGLRFECVVDPNALSRNIQLMRALGATIHRVTAPVNGDYLAARLLRVRELLNTNPKAWWPNQYANPNNPRSHELGTIQEIDEQFPDGGPDYLFVATSSTGTIGGCQRYLQEKGSKTRIVAVDAVGSVLFGGNRGPRKIPGLGAGVMPRLAQDVEIGRVERITDWDCVTGCRRMAATEAMLVGGSAGGVLEAVRRCANELAGKTCVAILHDSGERYLSTVFNDEWVKSELGMDPDSLVV